MKLRSTYIIKDSMFIPVVYVFTGRLLISKTCIADLILNVDQLKYMH